MLEYALRGLGDKALEVLGSIAGFRMPARSIPLPRSSLLAQGDEKDVRRRRRSKLFTSESELDVTLKAFEDRGLLGWDNRANRYDLHPIVRGVVWSELPNDTRNGVFTSLQTHFDSVPKIDDWQKVNSLEDLTPIIELYNT